MNVWVLLLFVAGMEGTNISVIDNISSEAECKRLGDTMLANRFRSDIRFRCFEVEKSALIADQH